MQQLHKIKFLQNYKSFLLSTSLSADGYTILDASFLAY